MAAKTYTFTPPATADNLKSLQSTVQAKADKAGTVLDSTLSLGRKSDTGIGAKSVALGSYVEASGNYSFGQGINVSATGNSSHASGNVATASGETSFAHGTGIVASGGFETVFGTYNKAETTIPEWVSGTSYKVGDLVTHDLLVYKCVIATSETTWSGTPRWARVNYSTKEAFVIGNGSGSSEKSNAFEVHWDGTVKASGEVFANGKQLAHAEDVSSKQDAPETAGTAGQVLGLDSNLHPAWINQSGGGGGGTTNYNDLTNKPQIGGVALSGNKTLNDLGIHNIPSGGTANQVLAKNSGTNYDLKWMTIPGGSGGSFTANYVTPEDYGAVGDGTTDDTTAMTQAFNSEKPVVLTKGKNYFMLQADVTSPLFVYGNQATISTRAVTSSEYSSGGHRMIICENSATQVHIQDVNFVTTATETVNGAHGTQDSPIPRRSMRSAISCYGVDRLELIGCTFTNFDDPILTQRSGSDSTYTNICKNAWIKDCQIHNSLMGIIGYFRNLVVEGCEIVEDHNARSGEHGMYLFSDALETCTITGTTVRTNYVPEWKPNTAYTRDSENTFMDSYVKNGPYNIYHCTASHTSGSSFDSSKWELVSDFNGSCGSCIQFYPSSLSATLPACEKREYIIDGCTLIGDAYISVAGPANVYATSCNMKTINYRTDTRRRQFECEFANGGKIELYGSSIDMELMDAVNDSNGNPRMNVIYRNCNLYSNRIVGDRFSIYRAYNCTFDNIGFAIPTNGEIINCTFSSTISVIGRYYVSAPATTTNALISGCLFKTGLNVNSIAYNFGGTGLMIDCVSSLPTGTNIDGLTVFHKIDPTQSDPGGGGGSAAYAEIVNNRLVIYTSGSTPDPSPSDSYETIGTGTKTVMTDDGDDYSYLLFNNTPNTISVGEEYRVIFPDVSQTYTAIAKSVNVYDKTQNVFGNPGVVDQSIDDGSGLPFMGFMYNATTLVLAIPTQQYTSIQCTIQKKVNS